MRICSATACDRSAVTRGLCTAHYARLRHGRDMDAPIRRHNVPFWDRVDRSGGLGACWTWTGTCYPNGYGQYKVPGGRMVLVHRHVARMALGPVVDDHLVRHACDNRPCCNPLHLGVGDHLENMADMVSRGRSTRGEHHGGHRLTDEDVASIRAADGSQRAIAARFGIAQSHVSRIRSGVAR